jgi:hypothetical protein
MPQTNDQHDADLTAQAKARATHAAIAREICRLGLELEKLSAQEEELLRACYTRWPKDQVLADGIVRGAGLAAVGFPSGTFTSAQTAYGRKCVFRHEVLRAIAVAYADILSELLPAAEVAEVRAGIEADRARGAVYFAGQNHWHAPGLWAAALDQLQILRLKARLVLHGL